MPKIYINPDEKQSEVGFTKFVHRGKFFKDFPSYAFYKVIDQHQRKDKELENIVRKKKEFIKQNDIGII